MVLPEPDFRGYAERAGKPKFQEFIVQAVSLLRIPRQELTFHECARSGLDGADGPESMASDKLRGGNIGGDSFQGYGGKERTLVGSQGGQDVLV